jgi:hypothetical protein
MNLLPSDRTRETQRKYQEAQEKGTLVGLENEPAIVEYKHWKLIVNAFPYDERWNQSLMLVSKYKCGWENLEEAAVAELHQLKLHYRTVFDKIEENGYSLTSVPDIPHVHLLKGLKEY